MGDCGASVTTPFVLTPFGSCRFLCSPRKGSTIRARGRGREALARAPAEARAGREEGPLASKRGRDKGCFFYEFHRYRRSCLRISKEIYVMGSRGTSATTPFCPDPVWRLSERGGATQLRVRIATRALRGFRAPPSEVPS